MAEGRQLQWVITVPVAGNMHREVASGTGQAALVRAREAAAAEHRQYQVRTWRAAA